MSLFCRTLVPYGNQSGHSFKSLTLCCSVFLSGMWGKTFFFFSKMKSEALRKKAQIHRLTRGADLVIVLRGLSSLPWATRNLFWVTGGNVGVDTKTFWKQNDVKAGSQLTSCCKPSPLELSVSPTGDTAVRFKAAPLWGCSERANRPPKLSQELILKGEIFQF